MSLAKFIDMKSIFSPTRSIKIRVPNSLTKKLHKSLGVTAVDNWSYECKIDLQYVLPMISISTRCVVVFNYFLNISKFQVRFLLTIEEGRCILEILDEVKGDAFLCKLYVCACQIELKGMQWKVFALP